MDHGLANAALTAQVTGANTWHINADEPSVIDYNTEHKSQDFYAPDAYRASDHDPVVVGLNLTSSPQLTIRKTVSGNGTGSMGTVGLPGGDVVTYTIVVANSGSGAASNLRITDTIPAAVSLKSWITQGSAVLPPNGTQITWGPWSLAAGEAVTISFRATVTSSSAFAGRLITNTASFSADGVEPGSDEAAFTIKAGNVIYLPLVMKN